MCKVEKGRDVCAKGEEQDRRKGTGGSDPIETFRRDCDGMVCFFPGFEKGVQTREEVVDIDM